MSKMGCELGRLLDKHKYEMWEACLTFNSAMAIWQLDPSKSPITLTTIFNETIGKVINAVEGK